MAGTKQTSRDGRYSAFIGGGPGDRCLLHLQYVAREVEPREFALAPTRCHRARKFPIVEAANGDTEFAGKDFRVPEHCSPAIRTKMAGDLSSGFRDSSV